MTDIQIAYANYLESVRSHRAQEDNAARQAAASEEQAAAATRNAATAARNAEIQASAVAAQWASVQANKAYQEAMLYIERVKTDISRRQQERALEIQEVHNSAMEALELLKINTSKENTQSTNQTNVLLQQLRNENNIQTANIKAASDFEVSLMNNQGQLTRTIIDNVGNYITSRSVAKINAKAKSKPGTLGSLLVGGI